MYLDVYINIGFYVTTTYYQTNSSEGGSILYMYKVGRISFIISQTIFFKKFQMLFEQNIASNVTRNVL